MPASPVSPTSSPQSWRAIPHWRRPGIRSAGAHSIWLPSSGDAKVVELLLANGASIHARAKTRFRNTPLQTSLLDGQQATAKVLLDNGADALVRQAHGFTPLHEAALLGRRDLVDLLLDHGAELNSRADDGRTPLTEALRGGHPDLALYLESKGGRGAGLTADFTAGPKE